jgi:hypothetical protein
VLSAEPIRILFVASRDRGVNAEVMKLERAMYESRGPLAVAERLADAHVLIRFTEYRRYNGEKGKPLSHWLGEARLLAKPDGMTVGATPLPEHFLLVVIGEENQEYHRALESLARMLRKTLRLRPRPPVREAI